MAVARITREEMIEESVFAFIKNEILNVRGYPTGMISFTEAFVERRLDALTKLDKSYIAIGFNFDDGGTPAEIGSDLVRRTYTIEVWVMGQDVDKGRNLANAVRDAAENETGLIPLLDIRQAGTPIIDYLQVEPVRAQRQPIPNPASWQEALWIVHIPVIDEYYAGLT